MEKGYDKEMEKIHKEVENPEFVYCRDSAEMFNVKTKKLVLIQFFILQYNYLNIITVYKRKLDNKAVQALHLLSNVKVRTTKQICANINLFKYQESQLNVVYFLKVY